MAQRTSIKRYFLIYSVILVGTFFLFSIFDINGDYAVERDLWKINHKYSTVIKDHDTASAQVLEQVAEEYRRVIHHYQHAKAIPGVYILLGRIYLMKNDLEKAREISGELLKRYPEYRELCAEAVTLIAKTYEADHNWPQAKEIYQKVISEYSTTSIGLATPLYIANYYQGQNDFKNTMSSYSKAVDFYRKTITEHPNSPLEFDSLRYLANCYVSQNRWTEAVDVFKQVLMKYPSEQYLTVQRAELMIKTINTIVATQIKDYNVAIQIYQGFVDRYPQHPLSKTLKALIVRFEELKKVPAGAGNGPSS